jgi:hypothetical protein
VKNALRTVAAIGIGKTSDVYSSNTLSGLIPVSIKVPSDLTQLTIAEASELVRTRRISPVDLVAGCMVRIKRYNSRINAFITITEADAYQQARQHEVEIAKGN